MITAAPSVPTHRDLGGSLKKKALAHPPKPPARYFLFAIMTLSHPIPLQHPNYRSHKGWGRSSRTPPPISRTPLGPPAREPCSTASDPPPSGTAGRHGDSARFPTPEGGRRRRGGGGGEAGRLIPPGAAPGAPHAATHLHPEAVTWPADVTARQPGLAAPRAARPPKRSELPSGDVPRTSPRHRSDRSPVYPFSLLLRNKKSPRLPAGMRSFGGRLRPREPGFPPPGLGTALGTTRPETPPPPLHPYRGARGRGAVRAPWCWDGAGRAAGARGGRGLSQPAGMSWGLFAGGAAGPFCPTAAGGPAGGEELLGAACGCGGKGKASSPRRAAA